ncbi:COG3972 family protein [Ktedonobacteria bacterium brp13]|nr:COG3972 family protein [Ktedonobacteria bacterium brp13]
MLQFVVTLSDYAEDEPSQIIKKWLQEHFKDVEGICYYKYPLIKNDKGAVPEFTVFTRTHNPLIIRCLPYQLEEIDYADEAAWVVNDDAIDPPTWDLESFQRGLQKQLRIEMLFHRLKPKAILALPLISQKAFEDNFDHSLENVNVLWAGHNIDILNSPLEQELTEEEWNCTNTISQGLPPRKSSSDPVIEVTTLGTAIRKLDTQIRSLDMEQLKAATQIAPGPQRIRGLAGTGKTVLLAMRAANIHLLYPQSKILFTFHTRSLYTQAKALIREFYQTRSNGEDPNWDNLQIMHSWGAQDRPGVYSELCLRQQERSLSWPNASFQNCCVKALKSPIDPIYDYILVDEAQDLPKEFFQILYKLSYDPHRIYWAYDELQSLSSLEIPKPEDLFGKNEKGQPLVSLSGDDYPGGIEKDFVLHRSYRCPQEVLMLAHALGLGLYGSRGCLQMLTDRGSWASIGYEIESGQFQVGEDIVISRPIQNSPNRVAEIYKGQDVVTISILANIDEELDWIAQSIYNDIGTEDVAPEQIVVITLNNKKVRDYFIPLKTRLQAYNVTSIIPGIDAQKEAFAEPGKVTLTTVYRAKGNEAYVVYILGFDYLYDYLGEIATRNQAFTSITRSKAWVRITGSGVKMKNVKDEIDRIMADFPKFKFSFPDMLHIRSLDSEGSKRRNAVRGGDKSLKNLIDLAETTPEALDALDTESLKKFKEMLNKMEI